MAKKTTETRIPLSRQRVLNAAIGLADEAGIEGLSMRRLGQELGVEAMSLYNHVANKDDLLIGMLDIVVDEMKAPASGTDWKAAMRASAISAHDVLVRHAWACSIFVSGTSKPAASRLRYIDAVLRCLREAGFSVDLTHHAYHALDSHIIGFTMWQLSIDFPSDEDLQNAAGTFLRDIPPGEYPHFIEHVQHHLREPSGDDQSEFDFGLDLILDGLDRARTTQTGSESPQISG